MCIRDRASAAAAPFTAGALDPELERRQALRRAGQGPATAARPARALDYGDAAPPPATAPRPPPRLDAYESPVVARAYEATRRAYADLASGAPPEALEDDAARVRAAAGALERRVDARSTRKRARDRARLDAEL